jgi:serine/threonine protein kinase
MWSIGILATTLLTGDVIFTNRADPNYEQNPVKVILNMAAECDLSVLDSPYSVWANVHKRPKDFVKKLLVLDEDQRMTASQALGHEWFTHKFVVNEFDALYHRAIAGWEPRRKVFRLIEALDHSRLRPEETSSRFKENQDDSSQSRYFVRPPIPDLPAGTPTYGNSSNKRSHTPLPKITEEVESEELSLSHSKVQSPGIDHVCDVQHSLSQLSISVHSLASQAGTDIPMTDYDVSNNSPLEFCAGPDFSNSSVVPPPSCSSGNGSDIELIPDTPPLLRKRKSSPSSQDFNNFAIGKPSFDIADDVEFSTVAKKTRVV